MIIDIHNHLGISQDGGCSDIDTLLSVMDAAGIDKFVIIPTDEEDRSPTYKKLNQKMIDTAKMHSDRVIPFARIVPSEGEMAEEEVKRCIDLGVKGIKLKPDDGGSPDDSYRVLDIIKECSKLPVLIHTSHQSKSKPELWMNIFKEYPQINFVLAHGGKDDYRKCAEIVAIYQNVYADTTTLSFFRTKYFFEKVGAEKILFGSDYPYSHPAVELKKFEVLNFDKKDLGCILSTNSQRLFSI